MATIKDMSQAINSALVEIGVSGELHVTMDGDKAVAPIGQTGGDDMEVAVDVRDLDPDRNKR